MFASFWSSSKEPPPSKKPAGRSLGEAGWRLAVSVPCALLILPQPLVLSAQTPEQWQAAARAIQQLPPDSFPQLPVAIRRALMRRGCTVPQSFTDRRPHNVIAGRFAHAGREDWAVLCSRHDSSSILVFGAPGDSTDPAELERRADADFLQHIGAGRIGYSRVIAPATPARLRAYSAGSEGPTPKSLDHDGLEDAFAEKASTVFYLEQGRWLSLSGAD